MPTKHSLFTYDIEQKNFLHTTKAVQKQSANFNKAVSFTQDAFLPIKTQMLFKKTERK